jgi:hypothetical protein
MHYEPLSEEYPELRTLTIHPLEEGAHDDALIHCTLEHIRLDAATTEGNNAHGMAREESDRSWPEIYRSWDERTIFERRRHPFVRERVRAGSLMPVHVDFKASQTQNPSWRYSWGDYAALSYVWGSPTPAHTIQINGEPFSVGDNLYHALRQLRRSRRIMQGLRMWIDAICINQDDVAERSREVARMRDIYAHAWQVIIWLGPEADNSEIALTAMHWLATERLCTQEPMEGFYTGIDKTVDVWPFFVITYHYYGPWRKKVYRALYRLLTRTYWHRLWILQEIAMARADAPVLCGDRCIAWSELADACSAIADDGDKLGRDIVTSMRSRQDSGNSYDIARDRVPEKRDTAAERMWLLLMQMRALQRDQGHQIARGEPLDLLGPLTLGRDASVTNPKDRVYGVLGFEALSLNRPIVPDYKLSLSQIYQSFSAHLLTEGKLEILRLISQPNGPVERGWGGRKVPHHPLTRPAMVWIEKLTKSAGPASPECPHNLPSWAVCWACPPAPTARLRASYSAGLSKTLVSAPPTTNASFLTVRGVIFDTIISLSSFHPMELDRTYPLNRTSQNSAYGDLQATREAFWRSIVANSTRKGDPCPVSYRWLLTPQIWEASVGVIYAHGFGLDDFFARNRTLSLCGYALEDIVHDGRKRVYTDKKWLHAPTQEQLEVLSWAMNVLAWRRLVATASGRIGLAPAGAREGDVVAVLVGCSVPIVLRKSGEGWSVVGECYLHGVMGGEVVRQVEAGELRLGDIALY